MVYWNHVVSVNGPYYYIGKKQRRVRVELGWVTRHSGAHQTRQRYNSGVRSGIAIFESFLVVYNSSFVRHWERERERERERESERERVSNTPTRAARYFWLSLKKMKGGGGQCGEFVAGCCRPVKNRGEAMLLPGVNICFLLWKLALCKRSVFWLHWPVHNMEKILKSEKARISFYGDGLRVMDPR